MQDSPNEVTLYYKVWTTSTSDKPQQIVKRAHNSTIILFTQLDVDSTI